MPFKNPTRPDESPLRVETAGTWNRETDYQLQEEAQRERNKNRTRDPFNAIQGATIVHDSFYDFQHSKSQEVMEDKALDRAINQDLRKRNLKK